jgi:polar amino acid transport system substrate-binding protein
MPRIATGAVATALVLVLVAAGCGASSKTSATTQSTVGKDVAAAAQVPAPVRGKGTLTVAMDPSYAPDEFVAPDGHTIMGMDADLANAIGHVLGLTVNLQNATFDTIIPGLLSGKFDIGASSFTDTKEREKQVDFVTYFSSGEGFYVAASNPATFDGLESLCGHTVAVESGTTEQTDAQAEVATCQTAGKPADNVLVFQDQNGANLAVSSRRAEVGFVDSQVAAYIAQQSKDQFKVTGQPFATAPYGIALPKNGMAQAVLAAVKHLMAIGVYQTILKKWNIEAGAITSPVVNGAAS